MTYNAGNRKDVRAAEKAAQQKIVIRGEIICGLMSVPNGREWVHDLLAASFVFGDPFHHDPQIAAYNSGLRANGIRIFNDLISFCPQQFAVMIGEQYARLAAADERTRKPDANGGDLGSGDPSAVGNPDLYDSVGDDPSGNA